MESVLPAPDPKGFGKPFGSELDELFTLCQSLLDADPATRLVFTSREALPAPFDHAGRAIALGALSREDAIALVSQVMKQEGLTPAPADPGRTSQEITDLVDAVNRHARALVLLAREVSRRGVRATTAHLHQLMADLDRRFPGDRENSLYASVELSLRRLPPEARARIRGLGAFHGGGHIANMALVMDVDEDTALHLSAALIGVGLAEYMDYGHLRLDPALPPYLWGQMSAAEQEQARARWAGGMVQLARFMYEQAFKDTQLAFQLTLLELPNLVALLAWIQDKAPPSQVIALASAVEALLANLGRPQALAQATAARERAARALGAWSPARFLAESANIDRLLERGDLPAAHDAAQKLLQRSLAAEEAAYPGADYDVAWAHFKLGRVLNMGGAAEAALQPLAEARRRCQALADAGDTGAERMASAAITESADCLRALGRLDEAAATYEEAIKRFEKLDDRRWIAVNKFQLGTVRKNQGRDTEALAIYAEARDIFEALGEPLSVAGAWHQIGMVHRQADQFEPAERACRQALAISVQQKDRQGEASSLNELGNLYDAAGRLEEAVTFCRQAADIYAKLQDLRYEGVVRSNVADTFIKLHRYDEARRELHRAIECKKPYGHAATPWKTWNLLHDLEQATGNPQAAAEARGQAIQSYMAYRRAGGVSQSPVAELYALVAGAVRQGQVKEAEQILARYFGPNADPPAKALIAKLQAILRGERDPALAADPELDYGNAVEVQLLLEGLGGVKVVWTTKARSLTKNMKREDTKEERRTLVFAASWSKPPCWCHRDLDHEDAKERTAQPVFVSSCFANFAELRGFVVQTSPR